MSVELGQSLLRNGPVQVLRWSADRSVLEAGAVAERFVGLGILPGSDYLKRIHPDDRERVTDMYRHHERIALDTFYRLLGEDGRVYSVSYTSTDTSGNASSTSAIVVVPVSMNPRIQLEESGQSDESVRKLPQKESAGAIVNPGPRSATDRNRSMATRRSREKSSDR